MNKKPKRAVRGGTRVIISMENLEPIRTYDSKRNKSPNTNPIRPEMKSHFQLKKSASRGRISPLLINVNILRKKRPSSNLRIFTARAPILWLAASNDNDVTVQKTAVSKAANSPVWLFIKFMLKPLLKPGLSKKSFLLFQQPQQNKFFYLRQARSIRNNTCKVITEYAQNLF
jgi:hypothetical protein